jgi:hypothetical protein
VLLLKLADSLVVRGGFRASGMAGTKRADKFGGVSGRTVVAAREGVTNCEMRSWEEAINALRSDRRLKNKGAEWEPKT